MQKRDAIMLLEAMRWPERKRGAGDCGTGPIFPSEF